MSVSISVGQLHAFAEDDVRPLFQVCVSFCTTKPVACASKGYGCQWRTHDYSCELRMVSRSKRRIAMQWPCGDGVRPPYMHANYATQLPCRNMQNARSGAAAVGCVLDVHPKE